MSRFRSTWRTTSYMAQTGLFNNREKRGWAAALSASPEIIGNAGTHYKTETGKTCRHSSHWPRPPHPDALPRGLVVLVVTPVTIAVTFVVAVVARFPAMTRTGDGLGRLQRLS